MSSKYRIELKNGDVAVAEATWCKVENQWRARAECALYDIGTGDTEEKALKDLAGAVGGKLLAPGEFTTAEKLSRVDALSRVVDSLKLIFETCHPDHEEGVERAMFCVQQYVQTEARNCVVVTRGKLVSVSKDTEEWTMISVEMDHGARRSFVCSTSEDVHLLFLKRVEVVQSNNAVVEVRAVEESK